MANTGLRRFVEALLEVARKNGKSTFLAADGNTDLFIGAGGAEICCASNDDKQARLIWREIAGVAAIVIICFMIGLIVKATGINNKRLYCSICRMSWWGTTSWR